MIERGSLDTVKSPLGRAFKVRPLFEGGYEVTHIPSGLWMQTGRGMRLVEAAERLLRAAGVL